MRYTRDESFGFLHSSDGGDTFTVHPYPFPTGGGTKGVNFLHEPSLGIGDGSTWLVSSEAMGFARTDDAGATWTAVASEYRGLHGGVSRIHYTRAGTLYYGGSPHPLRTNDNGLGWEPIDSLFGDWQSIVGDGDLLYTVNAVEGTDVELMFSPEADGRTWTPTGKVFHNVPLLTLDPVGRVLYATGRDGVEALSLAR